MEFMALTKDNMKALNVGEFRLSYPLTPSGPTFFSQPIRQFPSTYYPDRFFAAFYDLIRPPTTALAVPQLRVALAGCFGGNPSKIDPNKIYKVSYSIKFV